ncbi:hypothetical protein QUB70_08305 [Microcoleus sp. A003_D6]
MPVPQENSFFVERASCPFLRMVQHLRFILFIQLTICSSCLNLDIDTKSNNGQKPVPALDKH